MFSGVLEWLFWKTRPSKIWGIATIMTITGCILLFINSGDRAIHLGGAGLAVCAGLSFAVYTNMSKQLMAQQEALPAVAMTFSICAVLLLPFSISSGFSWLAEMQNLWTMIFMGVMCTSIAYLLFLSGLQKISSSSAVTLSLAEPLTAAMLGVLLVGEHLSSTSWVGVAMLLGGIVVLTLTGRKNK